MDTIQQGSQELPPVFQQEDSYNSFASSDYQNRAENTAQPPEMTGGEYGNLLSRFNYESSVKKGENFSQLFRAAWEQDSITERMLTQGHTFPLDPNFIPTKELLDEYGKGLPDETQKYLMSSHSKEHMQFLSDQARHEVDNEDMLAAAGAEGFGARVAASLTDPVQAVVGLATGGMSAAAFKGNMLLRMATAGTIGAASNAAFEEYLNRQQLTRPDTSVAVAAAAGFALGGLGGAFGPVESTAVRKAGMDLAHEIQLDDVVKHGAEDGITAGKKVDKALAERSTHSFDSVASKVDADPSRVIEPWQINHSAGSAQTPGSVIEMDSPSGFVKVDIPKTDLSVPLRFDLFSIFARQNNPVFRWMNEVLHPDPVGGYQAGINGSEYAAQLHEQFTGQFKKHAWDSWTDYLKDNPTSFFQRYKLHDKFMELAAEAKRDPTALASAHPAIQKLVKETSALERRLVEEAQRHGVEGAEDIDAALHYVTRRFSIDRRLSTLARLEDSLGSRESAVEAITKTLSKAIRSAQGIAEDKADSVARAYYKTMSELPYHTQGKFLMNSTMGNKEYAILRETLKEINVDPGDIEAVMEIITGRPHDPEAIAKGVIPRFKKRTWMDETLVNEVRPGIKVKVTDLFENNLGKLASGYSKQLSGATGMAKVGLKSNADFMRYMKQADVWATEHGIDPSTHASHSQYMMDTFKTIMGMPLEENPGSVGNRSLKILRDYNFFRMMGQAGIAQIAEIGNTMGYVGTKLFMQHIPSFKQIIDVLKGKSGDYDQLGKDIHMMFGIGTDMREMPDITPLSQVSFHKGITALENVTNIGKYTTSRVSGMSSINNFLHQLSYRTVAAKIVDNALGHSKLSEVQLKKMATAGLSKSDLNALSKLLKKHTTIDSKGKLTGINYESMSSSNPELYDKFKIAIHREARRAVQQMLRGESHPWMHKLLGQNLMQFRGFMMGAYGKQLLWGLSHMDRDTAAMWSYSMMLGGLAYVAQTTMNNAGNPEELHKRLQTKEIAKAAFQRAGFSSVIPSVVDTATSFTSGEPIFKYGRTTGNNTDFITGSPVYNTAAGITNTVKNVSRAAFDNEYNATKTDVSNGLKLVLPNYVVLRNLINSVSAEYPTKNPLHQPEE